jgi:hypothetical protein
VPAIDTAMAVIAKAMGDIQSASRKSRRNAPSSMTLVK